jgi:hypothetical protein
VWILEIGRCPCFSALGRCSNSVGYTVLVSAETMCSRPTVSFFNSFLTAMSSYSIQFKSLQFDSTDGRQGCDRSHQGSHKRCHQSRKGCSKGCRNRLVSILCVCQIGGSSQRERVAHSSIHPLHVRTTPHHRYHFHYQGCHQRCHQYS